MGVESNRPSGYKTLKNFGCGLNPMRTLWSRHFWIGDVQRSHVAFDEVEAREAARAVIVCKHPTGGAHTPPPSSTTSAAIPKFASQSCRLITAMRLHRREYAGMEIAKARLNVTPGLQRMVRRVLLL